ncbi:MAG: hypothetical protein HZA77_01065 [Candidatus Schekmanbacteria bacterium]|nr:hypothetical protein [Candidatus Schekmanbacteria bacterium]
MQFKKLIFLLFFIPFLLTFKSSAQELKLIGSYGGEFYDIKVSGNYAYVAGINGLSIFDVSDSSSPELITTFPTQDKAKAVFIAGDKAYIAANSKGLVIVDISAPSSPQLLGSLKISGYAKDVFVDGNTAYIATGKAGIKIIDVTTPEAPKLISSYKTFNALGLYVVENTVYVADGKKGLQIVDVSNLGKPKLKSKYHETYLSFKGLIVSNDIAYIVTEDELLISDLSDLSYIYSINTYYADFIRKIQLSENKIYLQTSNALQILDITDPIAPTCLGTYENNSSQSGFSVSESTAYIVSTYGDNFNNGKLDIINISDPSTPQLLGTYNAPESPYMICVSEPFIYFNNGDGITIMDVSNPANTSTIGKYAADVNSYIDNISISDNIIYGINYDNENWTDTLVAIDVSNPLTPTLLSSFEDNETRGLFISDHKAYVPKWPSGFDIIDYSNPSSPALLSSFETDVEIVKLFATGNKAYACSLNKMQIVDIGNPSKPKLLGTYSLPPNREIENLIVFGEKAFIQYLFEISDSDAHRGKKYSAITVIDVSKPSKPKKIGEYKIGNNLIVRCIKSLDNNLYISYYKDHGNYSSYLDIIDFGNPKYPKCTDSFNTRNSFFFDFGADGKIFAISNDADIQILELSKKQKN